MIFLKSKVLKFSVVWALLFSVGVSQAGIFSGFTQGCAKIFSKIAPNKNGSCFGTGQVSPGVAKGLFVASGICAVALFAAVFAIVSVWRKSERWSRAFEDASPNNADVEDRAQKIENLKKKLNGLRDINASLDPLTGLRPVDLACMENSVKILKWLVKEKHVVLDIGVDKHKIFFRPGFRVSLGQLKLQTPIERAIEFGSLDVFKFLIDRTIADVKNGKITQDTLDDNMNSIIKKATRYLRLEMIQYVIEKDIWLKPISVGKIDFHLRGKRELTQKYNQVMEYLRENKYDVSGVRSLDPVTQ